MFRRALIAAGALVLLAAGTALAQQFVVEVSAGGGDQADNLYCRVGKIKDDGALDWGNKTRIGKGRGPSVAIDAKVAVLVNRGSSSDNKDELLYRVGTVDLTTMLVTWGAEVKYTTGDRPAVALHDTRVVEVHQSEDGDRLWIMTGTIDVARQQIAFTPGVKYDADGSNPAIGTDVSK